VGHLQRPADRPLGRRDPLDRWRERRDDRERRDGGAEEHADEHRPVVAALAVGELRSTSVIVVVVVAMVMVVPAEMGVDGVRLMVVGVVIVRMRVNEERDDGGHRHRHHEHSRDEPLAHEASILVRTRAPA